MRRLSAVASCAIRSPASSERSGSWKLGTPAWLRRRPPRPVEDPLRDCSTSASWSRCARLWCGGWPSSRRRSMRSGVKTTTLGRGSGCSRRSARQPRRASAPADLRQRPTASRDASRARGGVTELDGKRLLPGHGGGRPAGARPPRDPRRLPLSLQRRRGARLAANPLSRARSRAPAQRTRSDARLPGGAESRGIRRCRRRRIASKNRLPRTNHPAVHGPVLTWASAPV